MGLGKSGAKMSFSFELRMNGDIYCKCTGFSGMQVAFSVRL